MCRSTVGYCGIGRCRVSTVCKNIFCIDLVLSRPDFGVISFSLDSVGHGFIQRRFPTS